jgi:hypothetical protein
MGAIESEAILPSAVRGEMACSFLFLFEQFFQLFSRCRCARGFTHPTALSSRFKILAEIPNRLVLHKLSLWLAALVVRLHVVKPAIQAAVQIRRTLRAGVTPAGLLLQLDLIATRITEHRFPLQVSLSIAVVIVPTFLPLSH